VLRHLPLLLYLVALLAWLVYCAVHTFFIGRMPLPRGQAVALGAVIALALSLIGTWGLMGLRGLRRLFGAAPDPLWLDRPWARIGLLALLGLTAALVIYGRYVEPRWLVVRELALGGPAQRPVRIAVISDLHISGDRAPWTGLAAAVNATNPDLILMLGDTLNRASALPVLHRALAAMRAREGKYAIRGNWEAWYWHDLPLLQGTGFRWLDGRPVTRQIHGIHVHLCGLSYRDGDHDGRGEAMLTRLPPGWRLFLYHTPDMAPDVPSADLYLAGHTHGGQISFPFYGALVTLSRHGKRFERGRVQLGRTTVYVNPGIGVEPMIPLRIGVRPEITLVTLGRPPAR